MLFNACGSYFREVKLSIINGPNLNLIGQREPEIYGDQSLEEFLLQLQQGLGITLEVYQSNVEGELINELHRVRADESVKGVVINAGAYTHTSIAIGDAIRAMNKPVVEVHISNVAAREKERQRSFISAAANGTITGLGLDGYRLAAMHLMHLKAQEQG